RSPPPASSGGDYTPRLSRGHLMVNRDWSFLAMRGCSRWATIRSPFAPRHPSLGREAQKLIYLAADVRGHRLLGTVAVDHHEAAGLGRGKAEVSVADALAESAVVPMEAVPARRPRPCSKARNRHGDGN